MSGTITVEIINPLQCTEWDELLLTQRSGAFFHSSHWARVLYATYGYKPLYFTARDNDNLLALIPLMEINSFLTGKRGVSLPFTDFCQPMIRADVRADEILETLKEYGEKAGWKYIEIRGGNGFNEGDSPSSWCYEHVLNLSPDVQNVHDNLRESHKRNIRKAQKAGVEVTVCDSLDSIEDFYRLNLITRKRHGLPSQPFSFFKNIHKFVIEEKHGILWIARYEEKVIAGALCVHFSDKAMYKYAASDKRYQHLRANNLVLWKAIEYYCRQGYDSFSLGRTEQENKGLRQYKLGWGAKETTVNYYKYLLQHKNTFSLPTVNGWHTKLLKRLPVSILRIIGVISYKHMG